MQGHGGELHQSHRNDDEAVPGEEGDGGVQAAVGRVQEGHGIGSEVREEAGVFEEEEEERVETSIVGCVLTNT